MATASKRREREKTLFELCAAVVADVGGSGDQGVWISWSELASTSFHCSVKILPKECMLDDLRPRFRSHSAARTNRSECGHLLLAQKCCKALRGG